MSLRRWSLALLALASLAACETPTVETTGIPVGPTPTAAPIRTGAFSQSFATPTPGGIASVPGTVQSPQSGPLPVPGAPFEQPRVSPTPLAIPTAQGMPVVATPGPTPTPVPPLCPGGRPLAVVPVQAPPGGVVYLRGENLSPSSPVRVGGLAATVLSASAGQLAFRVPAGMAMGNTSVTVDGCAASEVPLRVVPAYAQQVASAGQGLLGVTFELPRNATQLPDNPTTFVKLGSLLLNQLDVPNGAATAGFPGAPDLQTYYDVVLLGQIYVPANGSMSFRLASDDGALLTIDGQRLIANDGLHTDTSVSATAIFQSGWKPLRIDYFQGPGPNRSLQLYWTLPDQAETLVPVTAFRVPEAIFAAEYYAR